MSRLPLHELLSKVFESKELASHLFQHEDYSSFVNSHDLKIPVQDLIQAFTHKSFSHEFNVPHQEQLEFLGDAVLQLILTDELFKKYSTTHNEGQLSKLRSALVNENSLASMARRLELGNLLLIGRGEFKKRLFEQETVLADTFEALLAQIYRHHGLELTKKIFLQWLNEFIPQAFDENFLDHFDAKSKLQEKVLGKYKNLPRYTAEQKGELFEISLWINEKVVASGVFPSKKIGEKELAKKILSHGTI